MDLHGSYLGPRLIGVLAAMAALAAITVAPAQAVALTVTNLNDSGVGSLRQAILDANATRRDETITFSVTGTITLTSGQLTLTDDVTIDGPGAASLTLSGPGYPTSRVLQVSAGVTLDLSDVTIANGVANSGATGYEGGGIYNAGTLTVTNAVFTGNFAANAGGAIANAGGTLTVADSTFTGNSTYDGGGALWSSGSLTITGSTLSSNHADFRGGAIETRPGSTAVVTDSTFSGNSSGVGGGGVFNYATALTVSGSTFAGNTASSSGGGIYNFEAAPTAVTNSTFSANSATNDGGGIYNFASHLTLTNSTFSGNSAGGAGGGLYHSGWPSDPGSLTLRNTIVASSLSGGNCSGTIGDGGGNLQHPGADCGGSIASADPVLDALADNGGPTETMALLGGSPALDAAVAANCPATDQRGVIRPYGLGCDSGAYEAGMTVSIDVQPGSGTNVVNLSKKGTVRVALLGTPSFDPAMLDQASVCFGDAEGAAERDCSLASSPSSQDVNRDGILDLVLQFDTQQTGIDPGDVRACLNGSLSDNTPIAGCDSITTR